eukprot:TRINITY_DN93_c0_g1_i1.p1 TRINITY_DN93_c0_g1~~TRINITY_DN93_c0_g1_i1.p1  ORF type:complete len:693 (+),score=165.07 TRINITY_DN93_c0_g1_i1:50-2128(+)
MSNEVNDYKYVGGCLKFEPIINRQMLSIIMDWYNNDNTTKNENTISYNETPSRNSSKALFFCAHKNTPPLILCTLFYNGFYMTSMNKFNLQILTHYISFNDSLVSLTTNPYALINQVPGVVNLTQKDLLGQNCQYFESKYDTNKIVPLTWCLPEELNACKRSISHDFKEDSVFILKPRGASQGKGIVIFTKKDTLVYLQKFGKIESKENIVVSEYLAKPLLINNKKFDFRLYVLVSSFDPLIIYLFDDGLIRLASNEYHAEDIQDVYSHLTNYSINKKSETECELKWYFEQFYEYIAQYHDVDLLKRKIENLIVKTILACYENLMNDNGTLATDKCYQLLGFDVLIDEDFYPWILEVNLNPSLNTDSELDFNIKSSLLAEMYNIVGVPMIDRKRSRRSLPKFSKAEIFAGQLFRNSQERFKCIFPFCYDEEIRTIAKNMFNDEIFNICEQIKQIIVPEELKFIESLPREQIVQKEIICPNSHKEANQTFSALVLKLQDNFNKNHHLSQATMNCYKNLLLQFFPHVNFVQSHNSFIRQKLLDLHMQTIENNVNNLSASCTSTSTTSSIDFNGAFLNNLNINELSMMLIEWYHQTKDIEFVKEIKAPFEFLIDHPQILNCFKPKIKKKKKKKMPVVHIVKKKKSSEISDCKRKEIIGNKCTIVFENNFVPPPDSEVKSIKSKTKTKKSTIFRNK